MSTDLKPRAASARCRATVAQIPIIGISGRISEEDVRKARAAGMTDYLAKPVSPAALVEALERISAKQPSAVRMRR